MGNSIRIVSILFATLFAFGAMLGMPRGIHATSATHAPHDVVQLIAVSPAYAEDGVVFGFFQLTEHKVFGISRDGGHRWIESGLPMAEAEPRHFAFSPAFARDQTAFAATRLNGVFRSLDGGTIWEPINVGLPEVPVHQIAVSPDFEVDGLVVAATEAGLFRSHDAGTTWVQTLAGLTETDLSTVVFGPSSHILYAAGQRLHRSADGGRSWQPLALLPHPVVSLARSPLPGAVDTLAVAFGDSGGAVWFSTDSGMTFAPAIQGLTNDKINQVAFADDGTVFAPSATQGCFTTPGPFEPWATSLSGTELLSDQTDNHFLTVAPSPTFSDDDTVLLGSFEGLYLSHDRGEHWREQTVYGPRVCRALAVSPDFANDHTFYLGSYGGAVVEGVLRTAADPPPAPPGLSMGGGGLGGGPGGDPGSGGSGGPEPGGGGGGTGEGGGTPLQLPWDGGCDAGDVSWTSLGVGVRKWSGSLAPSPDFANDDTLFYGYDTIYRSADRGRTWLRLNDPGFNIARAITTSPDFARDRTVFIGTGVGGSFRSTDAGDDWTKMHSLPTDIRTAALVCSPDYAHDGTVFLASTKHGVWRSTQGGDQWTAMGLQDFVGRTMAISPDYARDGTVFVGTVARGLWVTTDRGESWVQRNLGLADERPVTVQDIAVSPAYASDHTLFVAPLSGSVYRSVDGGLSFEEAGDGLPPDAGRQLEISPDYVNDGTLIHTNHDWVYVTRDGGARWSRLPGFVRTDDEYPSVRYWGGWQDAHVPDHAAFETSMQETSNVGASTEFTFLGDSVAFYASKGAVLGALAEVYLDGVLVETLDLYSATVVGAGPVFVKRCGRYDWHTIRVTFAGPSPRVPSSISGVRLRSDGFSHGF